MADFYIDKNGKTYNRFYANRLYGRQGLNTSNPDYTYTQNNFNDYELKKAQPKNESKVEPQKVKQKAVNVASKAKNVIKPISSGATAAVVGTGLYEYGIEPQAMKMIAANEDSQIVGMARYLRGMGSGITDGRDDREMGAAEIKRARENNRAKLERMNEKLGADYYEYPNYEAGQPAGVDYQGLSSNDFSRAQRYVDAVEPDTWMYVNAPTEADLQQKIADNEASNQAHNQIVSDLQNKKITAEQAIKAGNELKKNPPKANQPATAKQQSTQQIPQNASWEQQRAGLAQAMAQSVKDNPDNPYAWDAAPGFGAVRGSNGEMKYVVPNEPYDPDKAYEREMRDRAYQYYMDSMSMAGSPFATPERKAAELARANSLAQAFGLGLSPDVAAMGGGGGLRAGQLSAEAKNAQALYLKGEENKRNAMNTAMSTIDALGKDNPDLNVAGLRSSILGNPNTFRNVNALDATEINNAMAIPYAEMEISDALAKQGRGDSSPYDIYKANDWIGTIYNPFADVTGLPKRDLRYWTNRNGKESEVDVKAFSPNSRWLVDYIASAAIDDATAQQQYNAYALAERQAGRVPMSIQEWLQQGR